MLVGPWIDVHAHDAPQRSEQARAEVLTTMQRAHWLIDEAPTWRGEDVLASMDRAGVHMQMLSNTPKSLDELLFWWRPFANLRG